MKLLKNIFINEFEHQKVLEKNKRKQFAYEQHLTIYQHALAYLGLYDVLIDKKISLWKKWISSHGEDRVEYYRKLSAYINEENKIITLALIKLDEQIETQKESYSALYQPFTIGMNAYEYEAND